MLKEPLGRELPTKPVAPRRFVDRAGDGVKLRALDVTARRIGDLVRRGPPGRAAGDQVAEADLARIGAPGRARRRAIGAERGPARIRWARGVAEIFVGGGVLGTADRRQRRGQTESPVEAPARSLLRPDCQ